MFCSLVFDNYGNVGVNKVFVLVENIISNLLESFFFW